jgi:SAM-dependent methyltransferase
MNDYCREFVSAFAGQYDATNKTIVELGSRQVEGQEGYADLRPFFPDSLYTGVDKRPGPGVDVVAYDLSDWKRIDLVLCVGTVEHVLEIEKFFSSIKSMLHPNGLAIVTAVFDFQIHDHPHDYWRVTPELMRAWFPGSLVFYTGPKDKPVNIACIYAANNQTPLISAELYWRLESLSHKHTNLTFRDTISRTVFLWKRYLKQQRQKQQIPPSPAQGEFSPRLGR